MHLSVRTLTKSTILVLVVLALSAWSARADSISANIPSVTCSGSGDISNAFAACMGLTQSAPLPTSFVTIDDDEKHKKKDKKGDPVATPEPSTWIYFIGAMMLLIALQRKTVFQSFFLPKHA
jgi:hypothetical protein